MGHVFISYSNDDHEIVTSLVRFLDSHGFVTWTDRQGLAAGVEWRKQIVEAIAKADVVLLLLSQNSTRSTNVRKELDIAEEAQRSIIPVEVEFIRIPNDLLYQLAGLQRVKLYADEGYQQLLAALRRLASGSNSGVSSSDTNLSVVGVGGQQPSIDGPLRLDTSNSSQATQFNDTRRKRRWLAMLGGTAAVLLIILTLSQTRNPTEASLVNTASKPTVSLVPINEDSVEPEAKAATAAVTDTVSQSSSSQTDSTEIKQELITVRKTAPADFSRADPEDEFTIRVAYSYQISNANKRAVNCRIEFSCIKQQRDSTNVLARYQSRTHSVHLKPGATEDLTGILHCYGYNDDQGQITLRRDVEDCSGM